MLKDELLIVFLRHLGLPTTGTPEQLLEALLGGFARIPYENLTKIIASAESSHQHHKQSPQDIIQGFIHHGTGGTCFPLTLTLVRFIKALGFEAAPILADRRYGTDTHCAAIVSLTPNSYYLIDPGYLIHTPCLLSNRSEISGVVLRYDLPHGSIELRPTNDKDRIDLYTVQRTVTPRPAALESSTADSTQHSTQHSTQNRYKLHRAQNDARLCVAPGTYVPAVAIRGAESPPLKPAPLNIAASRYRLTYKTTPVDAESFDRAWERSFYWEMMTYPIISTIINEHHIYLQKNNLLLRGPLKSSRRTVDADTLVSELAPTLGICADVFRRALRYIKL